MAETESQKGGLEKMENIAEKDRERDCEGGCRMDSPGVLFMPQVPRWGIQEVAVCGPQEGNPFTEHRIRGCFQGKNETVEAEGFYDGEGRYLVRFMPSFEGEYRLRSGRISWRRRRGEASGRFLPKREITGLSAWRIPGILPLRMERRIIRWEPPAMCGSFRTTPG